MYTADPSYVNPDSPGQLSLIEATPRPTTTWALKDLSTLWPRTTANRMDPPTTAITGPSEPRRSTNSSGWGTKKHTHRH